MMDGMMMGMPMMLIGGAVGIALIVFLVVATLRLAK